MSKSTIIGLIVTVICAVVIVAILISRSETVVGVYTVKTLVYHVSKPVYHVITNVGYDNTQY